MRKQQLLEASLSLGLMHACQAGACSRFKMETEEKSAYVEVLDYNRIVSFQDSRSLKEAIKLDLEEDLSNKGLNSAISSFRYGLQMRKIC